MISPRLPTYDVLTASSSIRLFTYTMVGVLVGWFAHNHRVLVDRLRVAAERDFLTGLLNTRAFDAALSTRLELGKPFGLVLGDMDNLKDVNDTEGHAVGNDVLRRAGEILTRGARRARPGRENRRRRVRRDHVPAGHRCRPCPLQPLDRRSRRRRDEHELRLGRVPARRRQLPAALPRGRRAALRAEADPQPLHGRRGREHADARRAARDALDSSAEPRAERF